MPAYKRGILSERKQLCAKPKLGNETFRVLKLRTYWSEMRSCYPFFGVDVFDHAAKLIVSCLTLQEKQGYTKKHTMNG